MVDYSGSSDPFNPLGNIAKGLGDLLQTSEETFRKGGAEIIMLPILGNVDYATLGPEGNVLRAGARIPRRPVPKGTTGGIFLTPDEYILGLEALKDIIRRNVFFDIAKKAYNETVREVINRKLDKRRDLRRGGGGDYSYAGKRSTILFPTRDSSELRREWQEIIKELDVPLRRLGDGGFGSFNLSSILNKEITAYRSRFRNVFLMVEFGTGQYASPVPRSYTSNASTPFKVSPSIAGLFGADTSWWFSNLLAKKIAENAARGSKEKILKARRQHKTIPVVNVSQYSFGHGPKGISPAKILFDNRGMIRELRQAYERFYKLTIERLNDAIAVVVPFWPKNGLKYVPGQTIKLVEATESILNARLL